MIGKTLRTFGGFILLWLLSANAAFSEEHQRWTFEGRTLEAKLIRMGESEITLKRKDNGDVFTVPLSELSPEDQYFIRSSPFHPSRKTQSKEHAGTIILLNPKGKVTYINQTTQQEMDILHKTPIGEDSILRTGKDSTVSLLFSTGTVAKLKPNTELIVKEFKQKLINHKHIQRKQRKEFSPSDIHLSLHAGEISARIQEVGTTSSFHLSTQHHGACAVRGTDIHAKIHANEFHVSVLNGVMEYFSEDTGHMFIEHEESLKIHPERFTFSAISHESKKALEGHVQEAQSHAEDINMQTLQQSQQAVHRNLIDAKTTEH